MRFASPTLLALADELIGLEVYFVIGCRTYRGGPTTSAVEGRPDMPLKRAKFPTLS